MELTLYVESTNNKILPQLQGKSLARISIWALLYCHLSLYTLASENLEYQTYSFFVLILCGNMMLCTPYCCMFNKLVEFTSILIFILTLAIRVNF